MNSNNVCNTGNRCSRCNRCNRCRTGNRCGTENNCGTGSRCNISNDGRTINVERVERNETPHSHSRTEEPCVINISEAARQNQDFQTSLWKGCGLQLTVMCIPAGGEIGLDMHLDSDHFLCIEEGEGIVKMGTCREKLNFEKCISQNDAVLIPKCTWHTVKNTGRCPLKLYSIYAPPKRS